MSGILVIASFTGLVALAWMTWAFGWLDDR